MSFFKLIYKYHLLKFVKCAQHKKNPQFVLIL